MIKVKNIMDQRGRPKRRFRNSPFAINILEMDDIFDNILNSKKQEREKRTLDGLSSIPEGKRAHVEEDA